MALNQDTGTLVINLYHIDRVACLGTHLQNIKTNLNPLLFPFVTIWFLDAFFFKEFTALRKPILVPKRAIRVQVMSGLHRIRGFYSLQKTITFHLTNWVVKSPGLELRPLGLKAKLHHLIAE